MNYKNYFILLLMLILLLFTFIFTFIIASTITVKKYVYFDINNNIGYSSNCRKNYCIDDNNNKIYVIAYDYYRKDK